MAGDFKIQRSVIVLALSALIIADVALAVYTWKRASPEAALQELALLQRNVSLLKADVGRAKEIQREIPAVQKDCNEFERSLFSSASGYSSVSAELGTLAAKAGLRLEDRTFHNEEVKGRPLTAVHLDATVSGNYRSIVMFLNGLQRSPNMYAIEGLSARSDTQDKAARGLLRVTVHVKTYFRAA